MGTSLTEIKTLIEKVMLLGLKRGKRTRLQIKAIIHKAYAEMKHQAKQKQKH